MKKDINEIYKNKKVINLKFSIVLIIIIAIITSILVIEFIKNKFNDSKDETENYYNEVIEYENQEYNLVILKNNTENYISDENSIRLIYGTLMIRLDIALEEILEEKFTNGCNQSIKINNKIWQIDYEKNIITVPNIYIIGSSKQDDTVIVEIENKENFLYIPLYLLTDVSNIEVYVDDTKIYTQEDYCNSKNAIDIKKNNHMIKLKIGKMDINDVNEIIVESKKLDYNSTSYIGEEDGALWREEALKRIEKYRKKDINIILKYEDGEYINDASLATIMTSNEFKFGTSIRLDNDNKQNNYTGINKKFFNTIGSENLFKWSWQNSSNNVYIEDILNFSKDTPMFLRGHCLWWDFRWSDTTTLVSNSINDSGTMEDIYNKYTTEQITENEANALIEILKNKFENMVLEHINEEVSKYPEIFEWDVINEARTCQYFKYYLYDKKFLNDNNFIQEKEKKEADSKINDEYCEFLAKCFDEAKKANPNAILLYNDNMIEGKFNSKEVEDTIDILNKVKQYTNNIDKLGVQNHVYNQCFHTPQSYYNQINLVLDRTGIKEAAITEYDNYNTASIGKYSEAKREEKANYLKDTLINSYSNTNITEFGFWVYNSRNLTDEERAAYESTVLEWLNYNKNQITSENGVYSIRLYKGTYTVEIEYGENKVEKEISVSDNMENDIVITLERNVKNIEIEKEPTKKEYIQNYEKFDISGGEIKIIYDDNSTKTISMSNENVKITGFDNCQIGDQTITVEYDEKQVTYKIQIVEKSAQKIEIINNISKTTYIQNYENLDLSNGKIKIYYNDETIEEKYLTDNGVKITGFDNKIIGEQEITITYEKQSTKIKVNIVEKTLMNIQISQMPNKLTYIQKFEILDLAGGKIELLYNDTSKKEIELSSNDIVITGFSNETLGKETLTVTYKDKKVEFDIDIVDDETPPELYVNISTKEYTNKDIILTIKAQDEETGIKSFRINNKEIEKNDKEEYTYIISQNGQYKIEVINGLNKKREEQIQISNIDRTPPKITGVQNGKTYYSKVAVNIQEDNLESVIFTKNGEQIEFTNGMTLEEYAIYELIATDKAGNEIDYLFEIAEKVNDTYKMDDTYIKNIDGNTLFTTFKEKLALKEEFEIQRGEEILQDTEVIATGDILKTSAGESYTLVVKGDLDSNGSVNIVDLLKLRKYVSTGANVETIETIAADIDLDDKLNIIDILKLRKILAN